MLSHSSRAEPAGRMGRTRQVRAVDAGPEVCRPEQAQCIFVTSACDNVKRPVLTAGKGVVKYAQANLK